MKTKISTTTKPERKHLRDKIRTPRILKKMGGMAIDPPDPYIVRMGLELNAQALSGIIRKIGRKHYGRTLESVVHKRDNLAERAQALGLFQPQTSSETGWAVSGLAQNAGRAFSVPVNTPQNNAFELTHNNIFTFEAERTQDHIARTQFAIDLIAGMQKPQDLEWLDWGRCGMQEDIAEEARRGDIDLDQFKYRAANVGTTYEAVMQDLASGTVNSWTIEQVGFLAERGMELCEEIKVENPDYNFAAHY